MHNDNEMEDLFKHEKEERKKHPMRGAEISLAGSAPWEGDIREAPERRLPDTTDDLALTQRAKIIMYCGSYATHKKETVPVALWLGNGDEVRQAKWWKNRNASAAVPMKR